MNGSKVDTRDIAEDGCVHRKVRHVSREDGESDLSKKFNKHINETITKLNHEACRVNAA